MAQVEQEPHLGLSILGRGRALVRDAHEPGDQQRHRDEREEGDDVLGPLEIERVVRRQEPDVVERRADHRRDDPRDDAAEPGRDDHRNQERERRPLPRMNEDDGDQG